MGHMQDAPFGVRKTSKLESSLNSKSQLRNDNEHFSPLRLSPEWLDGFVEALLEHGSIQDTVFNLQQVGRNHGACLTQVVHITFVMDKSPRDRCLCELSQWLSLKLQLILIR